MTDHAAGVLQLQRPADALPPLGGLAVVARSTSTSPRDREQWRGARRRASASCCSSCSSLADGRRGADHDEVLRAGRRARQRGGGDVPRHPAGRRGAPHAVLRALPGRGRRGPADRSPRTSSGRASRSRDAFRHDLRRGARRRPTSSSSRAPARPRGEGPLRHALPPGPRGHARPDDVPVHHRLPRARGPAAGLRRRLLEDPPRRDAPHRLRRLVPARDGRARTPTQADVVRATLRELLPAVAESLQAARRRRRVDVLGVTEDELRAFALDGLTRRLEIIGVPLETVFA